MTDPTDQKPDPRKAADVYLAALEAGKPVEEAAAAALEALPKAPDADAAAAAKKTELEGKAGALAERIANAPGAMDVGEDLATFEALVRGLAPKPDEEAATREAAFAEWTSWGDLDGLYGGKAPAVNWIVNETFSRRTAAMLAANGAVGKTWLALDLALAVAEGPERERSTRFLGHGLPDSASGPAVVLTAEDDKDEIHRRLHSLDSTGARRRRAQGRLFVLPMPDLSGDLRPVPIGIEDRTDPARFRLGDGFERLRAWLATFKPAVVVLDPLAALSHLEPNDNAAGGFTMATLNHLAAELNALVMMTHHLRKAKEGGRRDRVRGASALVNESRAVFVLEELTSDHAADFLKRRDEKDESPLDRLYQRRSAADRFAPGWRHAGGNGAGLFVGELVKSNTRAYTGLRFLVRGEDCRLYNVRREWADYVRALRHGNEDGDSIQSLMKSMFDENRPAEDFGGAVRKSARKGKGEGKPGGAATSVRRLASQAPRGSIGDAL